MNCSACTPEKLIRWYWSAWMGTGSLIQSETVWICPPIKKIYWHKHILKLTIIFLSPPISILPFSNLISPLFTTQPSDTCQITLSSVLLFRWWKLAEGFGLLTFCMPFDPVWQTPGLFQVGVMPLFSYLFIWFILLISFQFPFIKYAYILYKKNMWKEKYQSTNNTKKKGK